MKTILCQLLQKGDKISSPLRRGIWTPLLLPWIQRTRDFQTRPSLAQPSNDSHQSGDSPRIVEGHDTRDRMGFYGTPRPRVFEKHQIDRTPMEIRKAASGVFWSLVGLSIRRGDEEVGLYSGTIVHPDGIIATSANCFKSVEGTDFKIIVKLMHIEDTYEGVLLEDDFCSDIAFVKIIPGQELTAATFGKLNSTEGALVVSGGCLRARWPHSHNTMLNADCYLYNCGYLRIKQDVENTVFSDQNTSGRLIKGYLGGHGRSFIGGPLVNMDGGFFGIIHNVGLNFEFAPVDDVFKYLEHFKKRGSMRNSWVGRVIDHLTTFWLGPA